MLGVQGYRKNKSPLAWTPGIINMRKVKIGSQIVDVALQIQHEDHLRITWRFWGELNKAVRKKIVGH